MARSRRRSRAVRALARPAPARRVVGVPKSPGELEAMAASGALLARVHDALAPEVRAGATTLQLDEIAEQIIRDGGGVPAFKGYRGFPGSICPSLNDEVVHAIPSAGVVLADGDVLSLDCGVVLDGWVSDSARTYGVGEVSDVARRLIETTRVSLEHGIAAARAGGHIGDIGHAVQSVVEAEGFAIVETLVGHGVGRSMHEEPQVPNHGLPGTGPELVEGLVIAIEPMVNVGGPDVQLGPDGWTVTTRDGSLSAHWEHTVAITAAGPRVLTASA